MRGGIIIEGAEQQGKSTFCKKLVDRLGLEVVHFGPPTKDFDFFGGYFKDIEERGSKHLPTHHDGSENLQTQTSRP